MTDHNDLTRQGIAAMKLGDKLQATALFHQATKLDPNNQVAWLWLSGCVDSNDDKRACLEKVISINPNNDTAQRAQAGLRKLQSSDTPIINTAEKQQKQEDSLLFSNSGSGLLITTSRVDVTKAGLTFAIASVSAVKIGPMYGQRLGGFLLILLGGVSTPIGWSLLSDSILWGGLLLVGAFLLFGGFWGLLGRTQYEVEIITEGQRVCIFRSSDKNMANDIYSALQVAIAHSRR